MERVGAIGILRPSSASSSFNFSFQATRWWVKGVLSPFDPSHACFLPQSLSDEFKGQTKEADCLCCPRNLEACKRQAKALFFSRSIRYRRISFSCQARGKRRLEERCTCAGFEQCSEQTDRLPCEHDQLSGKPQSKAAIKNFCGDLPV